MINEYADDRTAILPDENESTPQHANQLQRYKDLVENHFLGYSIVPVYVQTGVQSDYCEALNHVYAVIRRSDILDWLERQSLCPGRTATLSTNFYSTCDVSKTMYRAWKSTIAAKLVRECLAGFLHGIAVSVLTAICFGGSRFGAMPNNETGGFLGYWFGDWTHVGGAWRRAPDRAWQAVNTEIPFRRGALIGRH